MKEPDQMEVGVPFVVVSFGYRGMGPPEPLRDNSSSSLKCDTCMVRLMLIFPEQRGIERGIITLPHPAIERGSRL